MAPLFPPLAFWGDLGSPFPWDLMHIAGNHGTLVWARQVSTQRIPCWLTDALPFISLAFLEFFVLCWCVKAGYCLYAYLRNGGVAFWAAAFICSLALRKLLESSR